MIKKERHRYLLFKYILREDFKIDNKDFLKAIWKAIWRYFGLREASKVGLWLLELDFQHKYGIIRFSHNTKEIVITAITLIREIEGERIILSPVKTSGTINCINKFKQSLIINKKNSHIIKLVR
jgi:RNase P/RNase MRP subunit POP5